VSLARVADEPTREEWRRLYETALAYRERAPWQWLSDADLFGVRDPASGEIGWCSVFGAAGELFGLFVYAGSEGLATYLRMAGEDLDSDELPYIQQGWLATFEDRPALDKLLSAIEAIGTRPRVVLTKGDHVLDALGPVAAALEIRVERARRLPALEQARRSMESFLQRR
jgi:hypothetical protein